MPPDPDEPTTTTRTKKPKAKKKPPKKTAPTPDPTGELIARLLTGPVTHDGQPVRVVAVGGGKDQPLTALLQEGDHTRSVPATELHTPGPRRTSTCRGRA